MYSVSVATYGAHASLLLTFPQGSRTWARLVRALRRWNIARATSISIGYMLATWFTDDAHRALVSAAQEAQRLIIAYSTC